MKFYYIFIKYYNQLNLLLCLKNLKLKVVLSYVATLVIEDFEEEEEEIEE
jgi:hypothetical protein